MRLRGLGYIFTEISWDILIKVVVYQNMIEFLFLWYIVSAGSIEFVQTISQKTDTDIKSTVYSQKNIISSSKDAR